MSCPNVQIRVLPDPGIMAETGSRFSKSSDPDLFETPAPKPQSKNLVIPDKGSSVFPNKKRTKIISWQPYLFFSKLYCLAILTKRYRDKTQFEYTYISIDSGVKGFGAECVANQYLK